MGLGLGSSGLGRQVASVADVLADLVGQDIVARSISLTQLSGSNAVSMVAGAKLFFGANDLSESGNILTWTGNNGISSSLFRTTNQTFFSASFAGTNLLFVSDAAGKLALTTNISAANAGATPATCHLQVFPQNALDATDWLFNIGTVGNAANLLAVTYAGSLVLPTTDSSGTPGAATIDKPTGRSAIALGASSVVITNALVTAASHVFIATRTRDATGLLPLVTTVGAGSFTVSTTANCTAALVFDWWVNT